MTSVLVTSTPTLPPCPVFGIVVPFSLGWLRTTSGVSPCGTCHFNSPFLRSIAESTPYGGLTIDSPSTALNDRTGAAAAGAAGLVAASTSARCACWTSAYVPVPAATRRRNGCPTTPAWYGI